MSSKKTASDIRENLWADAVAIGLFSPEGKAKFMEHVKPGKNAFESLEESAGWQIPAGSNGVSGSYDGSNIPPDHTTILSALATASNGLFAPTGFEQSDPYGDEDSSPGLIDVTFKFAGKTFTFTPEFWGHNLDIESCIIIANQALEAAAHPQRFVLLSGAWLALLGMPDPTNAFLDKWNLPKFKLDGSRRENPFEVEITTKGVKWLVELEEEYDEDRDDDEDED